MPSIMQQISVFLVVAFLSAFTRAAAVSLPRDMASSLEKRITHVGRGTWYNPSAGQGNCGFWDSDASPVVAISLQRYDSNNGGNCNQWIELTNTANGKVAYGQTRDSCPSCDTSSLDMSPSLFQQLAPLSTGEIQVSWHFMNADWSP